MELDDDSYVACGAGDCDVEMRIGDEARCDDCYTPLCDDHWTTCSGDDVVDGCDAGLCPGCNEEHIGMHLHERDEKQEQF